MNFTIIDNPGHRGRERADDSWFVVNTSPNLEILRRGKQFWNECQFSGDNWPRARTPSSQAQPPMHEALSGENQRKR